MIYCCCTRSSLIHCCTASCHSLTSLSRELATLKADPQGVGASNPHHQCNFQFLSFVGKLPKGNFESYHMPLNYFVQQFSKAVPPSLGVFGWKAALGDVWTCLRRRWARSRALSGGAVSTMSSKWAEINLQNCTLFVFPELKRVM